MRCEFYGSADRFVSLDLGQDVYEFVYLPFFQDKDLNDPQHQQEFLARAQPLVNQILYHELRHIVHCQENVAQLVAEAEAIEYESILVERIGHVLILELAEGKNLPANIEYMRDYRLRNSNIAH